MIRLRSVRADDAREWLEWLSDPEIIGLMDMVGPVDPTHHEAYLREKILGNPTARWFAIEVRGRFVGKVWLWNIDWRHRRAEVRILVGARDTWGTGVGSDALKTISAYAFHVLGLRKLYAFVHERNVRSRRAFLRAGFFEEATLAKEAFWEGSFQDVWRLALLAGDPGASAD